MKTAHGARQGFTYVELVISVAIISLLASIAVPVHETIAKRAKEQELRRSLRELRTAIDAYKQASDEGRIRRQFGASGYPARLEDLVEGIEDQRSPRKEKLYFLRRLPRDPFAPEEIANPADTWFKRSYLSAPDDPAEGEDVFDVLSRAAGRGTNGRLYRDW